MIIPPPPAPSSSQNQRNWEILVMLIQDKADTRSESWSPIWSRIYTAAGTTSLWESCEAVGHRTLNSLQHHEGAAVVVICDSVAPFLKMNSVSGTAPLYRADHRADLQRRGSPHVE